MIDSKFKYSETRVSISRLHRRINCQRKALSIRIKYIPSLLSIEKGKCIYDDFVYYQKWIIIILIFGSFGYQTKENMFHIFLRDISAYVQQFCFVV